MNVTELGANSIMLKPSKFWNAPLDNILFRVVPKIMAIRAPIELPRNPMKIASKLNRENTFLLLIPMAFIKPISLVRSCTLMSKVFMIPKPAAIRAIIANPFSTPIARFSTVWISPSWSEIVVPLKPKFSSSVFRVLICSLEKVVSNSAVALE